MIFNKKPTIEIPLDVWKDIEFFLFDIHTSWDCDEDSHRYNTPCRKCKAEQLRRILKEEKLITRKFLSDDDN